MPGIEEITDELYGLPPEEFTAARARFEKAAKATGDRDAAARIHALAKPTVTAWLANQLAREHRDQLEPLLELGAGLRDATRNLAGDQLRALSRQRNQLVSALVQQARQLARAAGRSVSEEAARALADTLHAALADEEAAHLLLAGRLADALHSSEFGTGFGDTADVANVIPISRKQSAEHRAAGDEQRRAAEQEHRRAAEQEQRRAAEQGLVTAQRALADATAQLHDAQTQAAAADAAAAAARERLQRAEHAVGEAERKLQNAQDRLDRM